MTCQKPHSSTGQWWNVTCNAGFLAYGRGFRQYLPCAHFRARLLSSLSPVDSLPCRTEEARRVMPSRLIVAEVSPGRVPFQPGGRPSCTQVGNSVSCGFISPASTLPLLSVDPTPGWGGHPYSPSHFRSLHPEGAGTPPWGHRSASVWAHPYCSSPLGLAVHAEHTLFSWYFSVQ